LYNNFNIKLCFPIFINFNKFDQIIGNLLLYSTTYLMRGVLAYTIQINFVANVMGFPLDFKFFDYHLAPPLKNYPN